MSYEIIAETGGGRAVFADTVTGYAFGPVFRGGDDRPHTTGTAAAECFARWLGSQFGDDDPRAYTAEQIDAVLYPQWSKVGPSGPCGICGDPDLTPEQRIDRAIDVAAEYGQVDGAHHKQYALDQILRTLAGTRYPQVVAGAANGWDEGVA
jgi:hypothetical protein